MVIRKIIVLVKQLDLYFSTDCLIIGYVFGPEIIRFNLKTGPVFLKQIIGIRIDVRLIRYRQERGDIESIRMFRALHRIVNSGTRSIKNIRLGKIVVLCDRFIRDGPGDGMVPQQGCVFNFQVNGIGTAIVDHFRIDRSRVTAVSNKPLIA